MEPPPLAVVLSAVRALYGAVRAPWDAVLRSYRV